MPRPRIASLQGESLLRFQEAKSPEEIAQIVFDGMPSDDYRFRALMRDAIIALARVMKGEPPLRTIDDPLPEWAKAPPAFEVKASKYTTAEYEQWDRENPVPK